MKFILLLSLLAIHCGMWAQSLKQAHASFDKYEYAEASTLFAAYSESRKLPIEDYKKWAYCYFVLGDFQKCAPLADSIVQRGDSEPFFLYMKGEANRATGNYTEAKKAYESYQALDREYDVSSKLESIKLLETWETIDFERHGLFGENSTKADMTGPSYSFGAIEFYEVGEDSMGNFVNREEIDQSELLLSRPFVRSASNELRPIQLEKEFRDAVVSSFTMNEQTNEVWLTIAQPLKKKMVDKAPHLFVGNFDPNTFSVSDLKPWEFAGFKDSSACAHATMNKSGNLLVFSKITSDKADADLYVSVKENGKWSKPNIIAELSTSGNEMYPMFMGDTLLSYSSDGEIGYGGLDLFTATISNQVFSNKTHLKAPINGPKDEFNFWSFASDSARYSSNRANGVGDDDKYMIVYPKPVVPEIVPIVYEEFMAGWETPIIYFLFDEATIIDVKRLDELIVFMNAYPESTLLVEGHSDSRGRESYNVKLALERAKAIRLELIAKGLNGDQILVESKGSADPQVDCEKCTEEEHAKNRYARLILSGN